MATVKLTDLNDFITPGQACIKPVEVQREGEKPAKIAIEPDGTYVQVMEDGAKKTLQKASVTLNDCLACSGCVTSAESVLIEMQNYKELLKVVEQRREQPDKAPRLIAVTIAHQPCASFAALCQISFEEAFRRLTGLFKSAGADLVFDTSVARSISLMESQEEFIRQKTNTSQTPVLASACPGWICYAEKTHGDFILPCISKVKSPQQVAGSLVKHALAKQRGLSPDQVFHVAVMPCFDKKLEASRDDFIDEITGSRDVDCVITPVEIETWLTESSRSLLVIEPQEPDTWTGEPWQARSHAGGGSGGYWRHVFTHAAKTLFGHEAGQASYLVKRSKDLHEATLEIDGKSCLRFATAYGFKNIQNVVRKMKRGKCPYDYVEIMACPSGCNNGGGQLRPIEGQDVADLLTRVESAYAEPETVDPREDPECRQTLSNWPGLDKRIFYTDYHPVEKTIMAQFESW